jgi:branched-subunit amino acid aminotransferase/4-amino-4-deoxychorismate lyase
VAHLQRLRAGLEALGSDPAWLEPAWQAALAWAREQVGAGDGALRLQVELPARTLEVRLEALPRPLPDYRLVDLPHPVPAVQAHSLGLHKGCLGAWHLGVLAEARRLGGDDALLLLPDGQVSETAIAAVGMEREGCLVLPPREGRVRSIAELWDLPTWADERGWRLVHGAFTLQDLDTRPLWCFNALRGLWPARLLSRSLPS